MPLTPELRSRRDALMKQLRESEHTELVASGQARSDAIALRKNLRQALASLIGETHAPEKYTSIWGVYG